MGTYTHLPPKFSLYSDFGHCILKMLENTKLYLIRAKTDSEIRVEILVLSFLGGRPPLISRLG